MFHHIIFDLLGGRHFLAPIEPHGMRILDIGTGTGLREIEMGINLFLRAPLRSMTLTKR